MKPCFSGEDVGEFDKSGARVDATIVETIKVLDGCWVGNDVG
jgi:hypothetical protein